MKEILSKIKLSLIDVLIVSGITSMSIGSFLYSVIIGFIVTGVLLISFAVSLIMLGGD